MKLDSVDAKDSGDESLSILDLGTDERLAGKYEKLEMIVKGQAEVDYDWQSVLEAIERDIVAFTNNPGFRDLQQEQGEQHPSDIYGKMAHIKGPWTLIASKIKQDLEDTAQINLRVEQLNEKVRDQSK